VGLRGDEIRIRIAAPPVDGAANEALIRLLADRLGVPRSAIEVTAGVTARSKVVVVGGIEPDSAARRLGVGPPGTGP
jgi:uncharacterized protein YggU (UPF0235/DUF167 family)